MEGVRVPGRARLAAVALAGLAAACLGLPSAAGAEWQRGVAYSAYSASAYGAPASDASLARLARDGNSDVAIVVTRYMADPTSTVVAPTASTPADAAVLHAMRTAQALGLSVTLKPQVDLLSGGWRGGIAPSDPGAWFASYEDTVDHYADLAREGGASMYVVGTELKSMTRPAYSARWRQLIAGVRARFSGRLTYAANWDEFQQVGFWPSLDYVGVDAYFRLADASDEPVASLVSAWSSRGIIGALRNAAFAAGKPVILTEIGYRSIAGAAIHPGIWDSIAPYDAKEQANAYEAAYEALVGRGWLAGLYWWSWPAALPADSWNGDYTPTFKPAEDVMRNWNARLAPAPAAPAPAAPVVRPPAIVQQPARPSSSSRKRPAKRRHAKRRHPARRCRTRRRGRRVRSAASWAARRGRTCRAPRRTGRAAPRSSAAR